MPHDHHDDFQVEPIPGLPEALPQGEEILWQGRPSWIALAVEAFGVLWVAAITLGLAAWRVIAAFAGAPWEANIALAIAIAILGGGLAAVLCLAAWLQARETVYTLTTGRVVMRFGVMQTMKLQIPFNRIRNAALSIGRSGAGTIALDITGAGNLSYILSWPHVRPWHTRPMQPALRCIAGAQDVAQLLAEAAETALTAPTIDRTPAYAAAATAAE
jgi:hypothetical protein